MSTLFFLKLVVACAISTIICGIVYSWITHSTGDDNNIFGTIGGFFLVCTFVAIFLTAWSWVLE